MHISHLVSSDLHTATQSILSALKSSNFTLSAPFFCKTGFLLYVLSLWCKIGICWELLNLSNATNSCRKFIIQKRVNIVQKMGLKCHCAARPQFLGSHTYSSFICLECSFTCAKDLFCKHSTSLTNNMKPLYLNHNHYQQQQQ